MENIKLLSMSLAAGLMVLGSCLSAQAQPALLYKLIKTVPIGGSIKWDYLHFDPASDRIYVSHGTEITVLNAKTDNVIGHVKGLAGSHGVAIDATGGLGYADSALTETTIVFDLKTLKAVKTIPALLDADGMVYDPASGQVFNVGGDANAALAVNAATNQPVTTIPLGGAPEFLVADNAGSVYVNINDKNEIVRIDTKADKIVARWPVAPCDSPTGLAIDTVTRRLFSSCHNGVMVVMDADSGKMITSLPIGKGTDAAAFDPARKLAFSSNKDGTLTVVKENGPNDFTVIGTVNTAPGARTMAVDPATGNLFLVTATVKSTSPADAPGGAPHFVFVPGTVKILVFGPAG